MWGTERKGKKERKKKHQNVAIIKFWNILFYT